MPFDWQAFLELAANLQEQAAGAEKPEALHRTAVSRAYYSAFCHARNYARDHLKFAPRNDAEDHGRLRAHLKGKKRKGDADRLDQLRQWRNDCDYLDDLAGDLTLTVETAILVSRRVFESLMPPKAK